MCSLPTKTSPKNRGFTRWKTGLQLLSPSVRATPRQARCQHLVAILFEPGVRSRRRWRLSTWLPVPWLCERTKGPIERPPRWVGAGEEQCRPLLKKHSD
ncbi:hypothetical protein AAFF_G00012680 [Aldrovandia affinis]|uniref:Uncharacterized protein n=1 Tax=Aldrovandia affinis TaxID=143900 RepID=A0AAD7WHL9_9TELE|nr:hypothetical protein AAFF_G00012680 [Aldrovandia affinis]